MENSDRFKALIIDDEQPARSLIVNYLETFPEINIVGECSNGFEALVKIRETNPHILFLDVEMPKINGLELLEVIEESPIVVFTTAYDQYAIKAFELNAVDYLLKPFSKERFDAAVNKVLDKIRTGQTIPKISPAGLRSNIQENLTRIVVKNGNNINVIPVNEINFIEAQEDYVMIYTNKSKYLKSQTMNFLEQNLPENQFIRIHRSYIVNIEKIDKIEPYDKESYIAIIQPAFKLRISRSGYKKLKNRLKF